VLADTFLLRRPILRYDAAGGREWQGKTLI
jgi:hypothetical protein